MIPTHIFQQAVANQVNATNPRQMNRAAWGRVLGVMTAYYNSSGGDVEQRSALQILGLFGSTT